MNSGATVAYNDMAAGASLAFGIRAVKGYSYREQKSRCEEHAVINMIKTRLAAARTILSQPPAKASQAASDALLRPTSSPQLAWSEYLAARGWLSPRFAAADPADQMAALAIISSSLSFPLTLARSLALLLPNHRPHEQIDLCVIGSRAESTFPISPIWSELVSLSDTRDVTLRLCGPKAAPPPGVASVREWTHPDGKLLRLSIPETGHDAADLFHRSKLGRALLTGTPDPELMPPLPDAFVLFNPGTGEPGWEKAWAPTLRALSIARRPLLMTALSSGDAARDSQFLASAVNLDAEAAAAFEGAPYEANPFASLSAATAVDGPGAANLMARVVHFPTAVRATRTDI